MLDLKVFIVKLATIDGLSASSSSMREITTLDLQLLSQIYCEKKLRLQQLCLQYTANLNHKIWNDAMKLAPLEVQRLPHLTNSFLPRTQGSKVFGSFGYCLSEQSHDPDMRILAQHTSKRNESETEK